MREFLASDVLYERARSEITDALDEQGIDGEVPASTFLPEPIDLWLDDLQIAALLAQVAGETGAAGDTTRGTELSTVIIRPGNVPLTPDTLNQLSEDPDRDRGRSPQRRGQRRDRRAGLLRVSRVDRTHPGRDARFARINPGETASVALPIVGEIPYGDELTLIVTVFPVPGESIVDNNELPTKSASAADGRYLRAMPPLSVAFLGPAGTFSDDALARREPSRCGRSRIRGLPRRSTMP